MELITIHSDIWENLVMYLVLLRLKKTEEKAMGAYWWIKLKN